MNIAAELAKLNTNRIFEVEITFEHISIQKK